MVSKINDITIIGGGPIGLFAAGIAGEQGALCNLIESRLHLGGIMMAAYPDKDVYNFPGIQVIKGRDLITDLIHKGKTFGMVSKLGEYVNEIVKGSRNTIVIKSNKNEYLAAALIIATGLKAQYSPLAEFIKIDDWNGLGIYENWPSIENIKGKRVAIICGTKKAPQIPDEILPVSNKFTWLLDGTSTQGTGNDLKGEIISFPWKLSEISGYTKPDCVVVLNDKNSEKRSIEIDAVISLVDLQPRQTPYSNFGIEMLGPQVKVDQRMQSNIKRVYAIGDIAYYPGKIMLLSTGIYEARIAVKNMLKLF